MYSAIKVDGRKLYDYAREGKKVEIPIRNIEIYNMNLIEISLIEKQIKFRVECSKGTYIRTLCEDIAERLGTIGFMKELNRIQVGEFNIEQSVKINELKENKNNMEYLRNHIISIEKLFEGKEIIKLQEKELEKFLNGVKIGIDKKDGIYKIYDDKEKFIGIGVEKNKKMKRDVIL